MATNQLRRVRRTRRLTRKEAARDQAIRQQIQREFPPAEQAALSDSLSEALKETVRESGMTEYQIAKRAGISQIMLSRFLSGERDIRLATADKLAHALGLRLVPA